MKKINDIGFYIHFDGKAFTGDDMCISNWSVMFREHEFDEDFFIGRVQTVVKAGCSALAKGLFDGAAARLDFGTYDTDNKGEFSRVKFFISKNDDGTFNLNNDQGDAIPDLSNDHGDDIPDYTHGDAHLIAAWALDTIKYDFHDVVTHMKKVFEGLDVFEAMKKQNKVKYAGKGRFCGDPGDVYEYNDEAFDATEREIDFVNGIGDDGEVVLFWPTGDDIPKNVAKEQVEMQEKV